MKVRLENQAERPKSGDNQICRSLPLWSSHHIEIINKEYRFKCQLDDTQIIFELIHDHSQQSNSLQAVFRDQTVFLETRMNAKSIQCLFQNIRKCWPKCIFIDLNRNQFRLWNELIQLKPSKSLYLRNKEIQTSLSIQLHRLIVNQLLGKQEQKVIDQQLQNLKSLQMSKYREIQYRQQNLIEMCNKKIELQNCMNRNMQQLNFLMKEARDLQDMKNNLIIKHLLANKSVILVQQDRSDFETSNQGFYYGQRCKFTPHPDFSNKFKITQMMANLQVQRKSKQFGNIILPNLYPFPSSGRYYFSLQMKDIYRKQINVGILTKPELLKSFNKQKQARHYLQVYNSSIYHNEGQISQCYHEVSLKSEIIVVVDLCERLLQFYQSERLLASIQLSECQDNLFLFMQMKYDGSKVVFKNE